MGFSPFASGHSVLNAATLVHAAGYVVVALALAVWSFSKRDL